MHVSHTWMPPELPLLPFSEPRTPSPRILPLPQGLSGGVIAVYPPRESTFKAEDNILVGNVVLYGEWRWRGGWRGGTSMVYRLVLLPVLCMQCAGGAHP